MPDTQQSYVDKLTTQLCCRHAPLLATAEDDNAVLRSRLALAVPCLHNSAYDYNTRRAIARAIGVPEPAPEVPQ